MISLRERNCQGVIKIGVMEVFSNNNVTPDFKPLPMDIDPATTSTYNHADDVMRVIKYYIPNAEIHLVPFTLDGRTYLIEQNVQLVNVSLESSRLPISFVELSEKSFILASAGNSGSEGEGLLAQVEKVCAVGAVTANLTPQSYSSYGKGAIKTCAITGLNIYNPNRILHGTSYAAPVITGLLAQWYVWYHENFNVYPTIAQTNEFVIKNSHDIFDDSWDMKTGYGLLRLPKYFEATKSVFKVGSPTAKIVKYKENETPLEKEITLLAPAKTENGRTIVAASDITDICVMSRYWNGTEAEYVKG
jgi:hypothetical protein